MKRTWKKYAVLLMAFVVFGMWGITAGAGTVSSYNIEVTYAQTAAHMMLDGLNTFRTSESEAWYWDEDNATKITFAGEDALDALDYDYGLELIAMQRAAEIAMSFSHTRPMYTEADGDSGKVYSMIS